MLAPILYHGRLRDPAGKTERQPTAPLPIHC